MKLFIKNLYNAYIESDASLFEINPVIKSSDNKIIAVDAKVTLMTMLCLGMPII